MGCVKDPQCLDANNTSLVLKDSSLSDMYMYMYMYNIICTGIRSSLCASEKIVFVLQPLFVIRCLGTLATGALNL